MNTTRYVEQLHDIMRHLPYSLSEALSYFSSRSLEAHVTKSSSRSQLTEMLVTLRSILGL